MSKWRTALLFLVLTSIGAACSDGKPATAASSPAVDATSTANDETTGSDTAAGDAPATDIGANDSGPTGDGPACTTDTDCQTLVNLGTWPSKPLAPCAMATCQNLRCGVAAKPAGATCADTDNLPCTHATCSATAACENTQQIDSGWCAIAGACIAANATHPDNPCLQCDPAQSKTDWSPTAKGSPCQDSMDCTVDSCDGKGTCDSSTLMADTCLVQDGGKPRCMVKGEPKTADLTCQVCDPAKDPKQFTDLGEGAACTPGKPCLLGLCKSGTCESQGANPNSCLITADDACVAAKALNPQNPCQICDPAQSQTVWSNLPAAAACTSDDIGCTVDSCDGKGTCLHTPDDTACADKDGPCKTGSCDAVAAKTCVALPKDPTVVCEGDGVACTVEVCDGKSNCNATGKPTDTLCDDKVACTLDTCDAQKGCQHTPQDTACPDGNACTADVCDAQKGCSNPPMSDGAPCKLDDLACTGDTCSKGSCVAPITDGNCLIGGTCYSDGETSEGGCSWCNSAAVNDKWTLLADSAPCATDNQPCTDDTCSGGKCQHTANTLPCTDDNVACTLDICAGGGCQHQAQVAKCDDGLPCTENACDVKQGCVYTDNCPWGHECNAGAKACLTTGGQAVELVKTSLADPSPTNAALGRHDLDSTGNSQRTWLVWQSQSCATVVGGAWNMTQGAQLRAMALDPQVVAAGSKVKPETVNLPQAGLWNGSGTVCQAFPQILKDPGSKERVWLSWLEADPKAPKCVDAGGKGGVLRLARLDGKTANGVVDVAGEVCDYTSGSSPLFQSPGIAVLAGAATSDPTKVTLLSVRASGSALATWDQSFVLRAQPVDTSTSGTLGSLSPIAKVHPKVVDLGSAAPAGSRYLALGVNVKSAAYSLYAYTIDSAGADVGLDSWATVQAVKDVFSGATDVCSLDAAVDDAGTLGVVVVARKGGKDEVSLITRTASGTTAVTSVKSVTSKGDCRVGVAGARLSSVGIGFATSTYTVNTTPFPHLGEVDLYVGTGTSKPSIGSFTAGTLDTAPSGGPNSSLAWRGLTRILATTPSASVAVEAVDDASQRRLLLWTWKP